MSKNVRKLNNPTLKKIVPSAGNSFYVKKFVQSQSLSTPYWHFHPEIELVFIDHGNGKRHIGNHISYYNDGDLLLIGSNVPHYGFAGRLTKNESEIIVQFLPDFLGDAFMDTIEMEAIQRLFQKSKQGLSFYGETKNRVGEMLSAISSETETLNVNGVFLEVYTNEHDRMTSIYNYVSNNFTESIELSEIASIVSMTVPAFCRYFKKVTNKTFTQYVNEYRIVHAQKLLNESDMSITDVCLSSGFNNVSHFNKQFKIHTSKNPRDYRKELTTLIQ